MKANAATGKQAASTAPPARAAAPPEHAAAASSDLAALQPALGNRALRSLLGAGTMPLPDAGGWSRRLHADLSGVRIATGPDAERAAAAFDARALTVGRTVLFGAGVYQPSTAEGRHLIAHELAHTLQNARAPVGALSTTRPGDVREREAHRIADAVAAGLRPPRATPGPSMLARDQRGAPLPARPLLWEPKLLEILDRPVREGDDAAAGARRDALFVALAAVPERDRTALAARLEHPALGDQLAQLFAQRLGRKTRSAALGVLRGPVKPVDESTQPAPLRTFLAAVSIRELPPPPVIDRAWRHHTDARFQLAGVRAPVDGVIEVAWRAIDRSGRTGSSGSVAWPAGADATPELATKLDEPGLWLLAIDLVVGGQVVKQLSHAVTVAAEAGLAALRGTSKDEIIAAAAQLSDEQIAEQAQLLRRELTRFTDPGKKLASNQDYQTLRRALDALEWQAALRASPGRTIDTAGPRVPDLKPSVKAPAPVLDSVDRNNRGQVRERVEALIRERGMAGARKEIDRAVAIRSDGGKFGRTYHEFMEELEALAALYQETPDRVANRALPNALKMLDANRDQIKSELTKYGIVQTADHRLGVGVYRTAERSPNAELIELAQVLHQLEQMRRAAFGVDEHRVARQNRSPDENKAAKEYYELALQAAIVRYPTILVFTEAARNQLTPRFTQDDGAPKFNGPSGLAPWIGWELNQKLRDIELARHKIEDGDDKLNIWALPPVIEKTKHDLGIAPGTVESAVVDDHLQDPLKHGWNDSLLMVFTLALGALLAIPTAGGSLVVAAGELTLLATDIYLFQKQLREYGELRSLTNTAIDPAHALLAEAPESAELLLPLLTLPIAGAGALSRLAEARSAVQSVRTLRSALARAAGNRASSEVAEAVAEARRWALKAFHNDGRQAEAFLAKLLERFGHTGNRIGLAVERGMTVAEYGADALATRLGVRRITIAKNLKAVASVEHGVEGGRLVVAEIRVNPATTIGELLDHARSAQAIERYNGVIGRLRLAWDRTLDAVIGGYRVNPFRLAPGSPEFRIFEEVRKHELILQARMRRLASALGKGDAHAAALLDDEIAHYQGERKFWEREAEAVKAGRGSKVQARGIEARTPKEVHDEALRRGYRQLPPGKRYRHTGSTVDGQEFEAYDVHATGEELDDAVASAHVSPSVPPSPLAKEMTALKTELHGTYQAIDDAKKAFREKKVSELRIDPVARKALEGLEDKLDALRRELQPLQAEADRLAKEMADEAVATDADLSKLARDEASAVQKKLDDIRAKIPPVRKELAERLARREAEQAARLQEVREAEAAADEHEATIRDVCDETDGTARPNASIGDGSSEAILREEIAKGMPLKSPYGHYVKVRDALTSLRKEIAGLKRRRSVIQDAQRLKAIDQSIARAEARIKDMEPAWQEWGQRATSHPDKWNPDGSSREYPSGPGRPGAGRPWPDPTK